MARRPPASSLFTTTDADGDSIASYAFYDATGNGHFVVNGVAQAANTEIDVSAANLSQVSYVFGATGSAPDSLAIRAMTALCGARGRLSRPRPVRTRRRSYTPRA